MDTDCKGDRICVDRECVDPLERPDAGSRISDAGPTPSDADGDGLPDWSDNCPSVPNADQASHGGCGQAGDACCSDMDGDGIPNDADNCPLVKNPDQSMAGIDPADC